MGIQQIPLASSGMTTTDLEWTAINSGSMSGTTFTLSGLGAYKSIKFFGSPQAGSSDQMNFRINGSAGNFYYNKQINLRGDLHDGFSVTNWPSTRAVMGYTVANAGDASFELNLESMGSGMPTFGHYKWMKTAQVYHGFGFFTFNDNAQVDSISFFLNNPRDLNLGPLFSFLEINILRF